MKNKGTWSTALGPIQKRGYSLPLTYLMVGGPWLIAQLRDQINLPFNKYLPHTCSLPVTFMEAWLRPLCTSWYIVNVHHFESTELLLPQVKGFVAWLPTQVWAAVSGAQLRSFSFKSREVELPSWALGPWGFHGVLCVYCLLSYQDWRPMGKESKALMASATTLGEVDCHRPELPPSWFNRHSDCPQRLVAGDMKLQETFRPLLVIYRGVYRILPQLEGGKSNKCHLLLSRHLSSTLKIEIGTCPINQSTDPEVYLYFNNTITCLFCLILSNFTSWRIFPD